MNKWILAMLLIASNGITQAQSIEVKWQEGDKEIVDLNDENKPVYEATDLFANHANDYRFGFTEAGDYAYWMGPIKGGKYVVDAQKVKNGKVIGENKTVLSIDYENKRTGSADQDISALITNADKSKVLCLTSYKTLEDTKKPEKILIAVFDNEANILWQKDFTPEYEDQNITIEKAILTSKGTVVLVSKNVKTEKVDAKTDVSFQYKIWTVTKDSNKETEITLENGLFALYPTIAEDNNGNIIVGGNYSNNSKNAYGKVTEGVYLALIDTKGAIQKKTFYKYDSKTFSTVTHIKEGELDHMEPVSIQQFSNGTYVLTSSVMTDSYYNDTYIRSNKGIAVFGFDSNLDKKFETSIANKYSTSIVAHEVYTAISIDKLLLLYNLEEGKKFGKTYRYAGTLIDMNGEVLLTKELDQEGLVKDYQVIPRKTVQLNSNTFVVKSGTWSRTGQCALLTIKR